MLCKFPKHEKGEKEFVQTKGRWTGTKKEMPKWLQDKERDEGTLVETLRGRGRFQGEGVRTGRGEGEERSWGEYYFLSYMNRQHISLEHSKSSWPGQPPSLRVPQSFHLCVSLLLDSASVFTDHTASFPRAIFTLIFSHPNRACANRFCPYLTDKHHKMVSCKIAVFAST